MLFGISGGDRDGGIHLAALGPPWYQLAFPVFSPSGSHTGTSSCLLILSKFLVFLFFKSLASLLSGSCPKLKGNVDLAFPLIVGCRKVEPPSEDVFSAP